MPGIVEPILQAYANANIEAQVVAAGAAVTYGSNTTAGFTFNGSDTFTASRSGIYALTVVLNLAAGNQAGVSFGVSINGGDFVAPSTNAGTVGQLTVIRVANTAAGSAIRIVNTASVSATLANAPSIGGSAGHLMIFRIADGGG